MLRPALVPHLVLVSAFVLACGPSAEDDPEMGVGVGAVDAGPSSEEPPAEPEPEPEPESAELIRIGTYNIKHGAESSLDAIAEALKPSDLAMVALQEVDYFTVRSGTETNQAFRLGQRIGRAASLRTAKEVDGGHQANALLYQFPMVNNTRVDLPQVEDEVRVLVIIELEIAPGVIASVGVVHLSIKSADRDLQVDAVLDAMRERPNPILIGDFNLRPDSDQYSRIAGEYRDAWAIAGQGDGFTFPALEPDRRIDYVFLGPGWPDPVGAKVLESNASDHRPLVVTVPLPAAP